MVQSPAPQGGEHHLPPAAAAPVQGMKPSCGLPPSAAFPAALMMRLDSPQAGGGTQRGGGHRKSAF